MKQYHRKPNTICSVCSKAIYKKPCDIQKSKSKNIYCGKKCYGKACRKEKPCKICSKLILSSLNKSTCSKKCSIVYRTNINKERNWGHGPRDGTKITTKQGREKLIIDRGGKCELCPYSITLVLNVHHVIEKRNGGTDDKSNLIVVCPNCHGEIHKGLKII